MAEHSTTVTLGGIYGQQKQIFEKNTKIFLDNINKAYCAKSIPEFPSETTNSDVIVRVGNLWASSPFLSVKPNISQNVLSNSQGNYEIRDLQIIFEKVKKDRNQLNAVLLFDKTGKIIDFKIALDIISLSTILRDTVNVTDLRRREMIINFVEDFRTSYNLRDTAFLRKVFSDKALIITGKILQQTDQVELQPKVRYTIQTKEQYLRNLFLVFAKAKQLNIMFDSIEVVRHPEFQKLYGVRLVQTWKSRYISGPYNDVGYLFLVIDFSVEEKPKIWVRAWALEDFFSLDSFVFNPDKYF